MSVYAPLLTELDYWQAAGLTADFWLRDDDAADTSAALDKLLGCTTSAGINPVVASVPRLATADLAACLSEHPGIVVWQHGVSHTNNSLPPAKKQELTRADNGTIEALRAARNRACDLFGTQMQPVLVPPWNRINPELVHRLPEAGFEGISTFRPRSCRAAARGVWQVNTHIDIIDWRSGRSLVSVSHLFQRIAGNLRAKRTGVADPLEPTGILTHHNVMEEAAWAFLSDLFALTNSHTAARWCVPNGE